MEERKVKRQLRLARERTTEKRATVRYRSFPKDLEIKDAQKM